MKTETNKTQQQQMDAGGEIYSMQDRARVKKLEKQNNEKGGNVGRNDKMKIKVRTRNEQEKKGKWTLWEI